MTGKRERTTKSNHEIPKKHPKGSIEARQADANKTVDKINGLQNWVGNRAVHQLLSGIPSHTTSSIALWPQSEPPGGMPLRRGSQGSAVEQIQQALLRSGYSMGKFGADGIFGRFTLLAMRRFQRDHHLPETDIVDAQTWTALMQAASSPSRTEMEVASEDGELPRVDLGPKKRGRAYMLDWESKHKEIEQDTTLREAFLANLEVQLTRIFGEAVTRNEVLQRIEQAEAQGEIEEAERMLIKLRIANQYAVVDTLKVEESSRYQRTETSTYCNIYAYDVVTALGGYLPRVWWKDRTLARIRNGEEVQPVYGKTVHELNANALTRWMYEYGGEFGWREENDISAAQEAANQGNLVILLAANANPRRSGHVTVLMPETEQHQAARNASGEVIGPLQSQAGARNFMLEANRKQWWKDQKHKLGAAWIFEGRASSPLLSPEQLGYRGS